MKPVMVKRASPKSSGSRWTVVTSCRIADEKTTILPCAGSRTARSVPGLPSRRSPPLNRFGSEFK